MQAAFQDSSLPDGRALPQSVSGSSIHDVVMDMMKNIVTDEDELITVYYGADVSSAFRKGGYFLRE